jgi:hypothetical protein
LPTARLRPAFPPAQVLAQHFAMFRMNYNLCDSLPDHYKRQFFRAPDVA